MKGQSGSFKHITETSRLINSRLMRARVYDPLGFLDGGRDGKIKDLENLVKVLWDMLSVADVWTECDDCSKVWEDCNIHKYCKVFFTSDSLEEFAKKIKEIPA